MHPGALLLKLNRWIWIPQLCMQKQPEQLPKGRSQGAVISPLSWQEYFLKQSVLSLHVAHNQTEVMRGLGFMQGNGLYTNNT